MKQTIKSVVLAASLSLLSVSAFAVSLDMTSVDPSGVNVTPVSPSGGGVGGRELVKNLRALYDGAKTERKYAYHYGPYYLYQYFEVVYPTVYAVSLTQQGLYYRVPVYNIATNVENNFYISRYFGTYAGVSINAKCVSVSAALGLGGLDGCYRWIK